MNTRRFFVIGTAHVRDPALLKALERTLDEVEPDQLILEMPDEIVASGEVAAQKPEMVAAYRWSRRREVAVRGHEPDGPPILRDHLAPLQIGALAQEMDALLAGLTTRRIIDIFCDRAPPKTPEERRLKAVIDALVDPDKAWERTQAIIAAVRRLAAAEGSILIICGGAHAPHIAAALPGCEIIHGEQFY